jgi:hypothetical protein
MPNEPITPAGVTPAPAAPGGTPAPAQVAPFDFETWLDKQSAEVKAGLETHTAGLKSALEKERTRTKKLDDDQKAAEQKRREAEMGEAQKWQSKAGEHEKARLEAEERLNAALIRVAFQIEAAKAGCRADRLDAAYKLLDLAEVEIAEDEVKGMDGAIKKLAKAVPELFGTTQTPPQTDAQTRGHGTNKMFASDAEKREFAARYGIDVKYLQE